MKVYTIINSFSVGDYRENDECTIMNFVNMEDALKAFKTIMTSRLGMSDGVYIDDENVSYEELFKDILSCGYGYKVEDDYIWIRCEEINHYFVEETVIDTFGLTTLVK